MEFLDSTIDWKSINLLNLEIFQSNSFEYKEKFFKTFIPDHLVKSDFDKVPWQLIKKYLTLCHLGREVFKTKILKLTSELNLLTHNKSFNYVKKTFLENQLKNCKFSLSLLNKAITGSKSHFICKKHELSNQIPQKSESPQGLNKKFCRIIRQNGTSSLQSRKMSESPSESFQVKIDLELENERKTLNQRLSVQSLEFLEIKKKIEDSQKFLLIESNFQSEIPKLDLKERKSDLNHVKNYEKIIENLTLEIEVKNQELKNIRLKTRSKELEKLISDKTFSKDKHFFRVFEEKSRNGSSDSPEVSRILLENEKSLLGELNQQKDHLSSHLNTNSLMKKEIQPQVEPSGFVSTNNSSTFLKPEVFFKQEVILKQERKVLDNKVLIKILDFFKKCTKKFRLKDSLEQSFEIEEFSKTRKKYQNNLIIFSNWSKYTPDNFDWIIQEKLKKLKVPQYSETFSEVSQALDSEFTKRKSCK